MRTNRAPRILRSQDLCNEAIHRVYKSVIVGKLLYAVSAWWGFTSASDRQRLEALIKRGIRNGLCSPDISTLTEMSESIDGALFQRIMYNPYHVIHHLLPAIVSGQLCNRNFIHRMLFKDCC